MAHIARMDMQQWDEWEKMKTKSQAQLAQEKAWRSCPPSVREEINRYRRRQGLKEL